jgi:hypothetical protein
MAIDEGSRHELFSRLEEVLGKESATVLMEHLPPVGWADVATKRDLEQLEQRLEGRLMAAFRGELIAQTRVMMFGFATTFVGLAGVIVAAVGLGL